MNAILNLKSAGLKWGLRGFGRSAVVFGLLTLLAQGASAALLTHRYPFDTNAADVIGGADGVLQGNAFITNGAAMFDGTNSGVLLPTNLFTNYDSISFEVWYVDLESRNGTEPLYEFSGSGGSMTYIDWIGPGGQGSYIAVSTNQTVTLPWSPPGLTNHLVWTQDSNSQTACLYLNGVLAGKNTNFTLTPAQLGATTNNLLGHSSLHNFFLRGGISECRVYQGALSALEVAQSDAAGPDQPQVTPGGLQDVRIMLPSSFGPGALLQPAVFADFAGIPNVNITGQPDLTLSSDNTNVLLVTGNNRIRTVGLGTADITAVYQGFSNTATVAVVIPQTFTLLHRYAFGETSSDWIAHDSVGIAPARVTGSGGPGGGSPFSGSGQLKGGSTALPPGIISSQSEITVEVWVNSSVSADNGTYWARIFDFGTNISLPGVGLWGTSYFFLTPATDPYSFPPYKAVLRAAFTTNQNFNETPRLDWTNQLPPNMPSHVAVTYSPARGMAKLYLNGVPVSSGPATIQLADILDGNNWLGKSQFSRDPTGFGSYDEFRIYSGFLQDSDIAADYAAGPNVIGTDYVLHSAVSGTNLTLSWGPVMANWLLESSPAVDPNAAWAPVNTVTNFQNGLYSVTLPMSNSFACFRLQQNP